MNLYIALTWMVAPWIKWWLLWRAGHGKEDKARIAERFGVAGVKRPKGRLVWLHAASVGESASVLQLINRLRAHYPQIHLLLTTGTVTSAALAQRRLPAGVMHQYVPVDTPQATQRFMRHWRPDFAIWVESELWPNLVTVAHEWQCFMLIVNARMSPASFAGWQKRPAMIATMLSCFDQIFTQTADDTARFVVLGAKRVHTLGNLKYDAETLSCDESELITLKANIGARPVWLAASTHPGEETLVAAAYAALQTKHPGLLVIIVPRHPSRGKEIAALLSGKHRVSLRSRQEPIVADTTIYIADTLGELGLFYRLSDVVFMGGSLIEHGGQNPLEPARLSCAIVTGPYTHNFPDVYQEMAAANACMQLQSPDELATQVGLLLTDSTTASVLQARARQWVESKAGATDTLLGYLKPLFAAP